MARHYTAVCLRAGMVAGAAVSQRTRVVSSGCLRACFESVLCVHFSKWMRRFCVCWKTSQRGLRFVWIVHVAVAGDLPVLQYKACGCARGGLRIGYAGCQSHTSKEAFAQAFELFLSAAPTVPVQKTIIKPAENLLE